MNSIVGRIFSRSKGRTEATVRQQYDRLAALYDRRWTGYISNSLLFLQHWVRLAPTATLLDVACGTGEFERLILAEHPAQSIVGVDISDPMLAIARQKLQDFPQVSFQVATAAALPFPDQQFDVVVSASAFHYFEDPVAALREMRRVLKPDGQVVILDWCRDFFLCQLCDLMLQVVDPAHRHCYSQAEFHHLLSLAGFDVLRAQRVRISWVWGLMVATAIASDRLEKADGCSG